MRIIGHFNQISKIKSSLWARLVSENVFCELMDVCLKPNDFYEEIRQHLEDLLNTKLLFDFDENYYPELKASILNYGISDFTQIDFDDKKKLSHLSYQIKNAILRFESRLYDVQVIPIEKDNEIILNPKILQLRISGIVYLKPKSFHAVFDSELDLPRRVFKIT